MNVKEMKIGESTIIFDFDKESIEIKNVNLNNKNKPIYLNKEYKNWENLIDLHSKAESGNIQAMEELQKEIINIIKER